MEVEVMHFCYGEHNNRTDVEKLYKTFFMIFWIGERWEEKGLVRVEAFADNLTVVLDECSL